MVKRRLTEPQFIPIAKEVVARHPELGKGPEPTFPQFVQYVLDDEAARTHEGKSQNPTILDDEETRTHEGKSQNPTILII